GVVAGSVGRDSPRSEPDWPTEAADDPRRAGGWPAGLAVLVRRYAAAVPQQSPARSRCPAVGGGRWQRARPVAAPSPRARRHAAESAVLVRRSAPAGFA